ncbi:hypothetical protein SAMN02982929_07197 [Saccharopolyspora kobensis]|uniref:Uncharacterized protein n=1 Tax=Saccharopolyspora kobensis TaxID=146035 RepID=A0A1H6ELH6_9PSEU|nr:hypothetical protein [Saccharopolyspora kobensis]SEG98712.1 hypothetical protein SAMN02982929_07197 [Saccharopolyspora kobensis]SFD23540.1 hypothetical protein SAMN05216506_103171 [Saccharopolyspora kobensis]
MSNLCQKNHLMAIRCVECVAQTISGMTLEAVENWWEQGVITQDALDGYRHVWAISAARSATYDHWKALPSTPEGQHYARAIVAALPSGRGN